jgi:hypothetical protein
MKTIKLLAVLVALIFFEFVSKAQPCAGSPGANTVIPVSHTICSGSAASMSLLVNYTTTGITYQWQVSNVSAVGPFISVPGATLSTYTTPPGVNQTIFFNVIITCANSSVSINVPHTVSVVACGNACSGAPGPNTIVPVNGTVCAGSNATLNLAATYTDSGITYQWGSSSSSAGPFTPIANATFSVLITPTLSPGTYYYNAVITCTNSSQSYTTTGTVTAVSCNYCAGVPGANTVTPVSQTICMGSTASMGLANSYSASGITYQWQSSNISSVGPFTNINGATSPTYTSGVLNATTYYNVVITCTNSGQSISVPHVVTVVNCSGPCAGAPQSTSVLPLSQTVCVGDTPTMSLSSTYSSTGISYQWASSTSPTGPFTPINGATLSTYTGGTVSATMYYQVVITCTNSGLFTSANQTVTAVSCTYCAGVPPPNLVSPQNQTICAGSTAGMILANSYTASGIVYQWQSSTTSSVGPFNIISGANANNYTTPILTTTTYYNVQVICSNNGQILNVPHTVSVVPCGSVGLAKNSPASAFIVHPNPNAGEFTVSGGSTFVKYDMMDLMGRVVLSGSGSGALHIDARELPDGVYYVRLKSPEGVSVLKIIKE